MRYHWFVVVLLVRGYGGFDLELNVLTITCGDVVVLVGCCAVCFTYLISLMDCCFVPGDALVICLEFASRIGFDRKVSCLTCFYLTRFPTAKVSFKLYLKLVRDILTLPLKLQ